MDGYHTMTKNTGSKISCEDKSPPKGFNMKNTPKPHSEIRAGLRMPFDLRGNLLGLRGFL